MRKIRHRTTAVLLVLALLCGLSLCGCRHSSVLEQVVYTMDDADVDYDNDTKVNDNQENNTDQDEDLTSKQETDDSQTQRDWEESDPTQGQGDSSSAAADSTYDPNSAGDQDAAAPDNGSGQTGSETQDSGATPSDDVTPGNTGATRQVVDATGSPVDIPEDVNTAAAPGEAAVLVQMLGGAGRLTAASESFTGSSLASQVFGDEDISSVETLWSGTGSAAMSDSKFALLLKLHPDVCIVISGQASFSDAQLDALGDAGIPCVTLPKLNTSQNLKSAVAILGEVLGDKSSSGGTDAPALADQYGKWYDGVVDSVRSRVKRFNYNNIDYDHDRYATRANAALATETNTGYYTLLISAWDADASYSLTNDAYEALNFTGMAVADSGYSTSPVSYYMSLAGVVNTAATLADQFKPRHWYVDPLRPSTLEASAVGLLGTQLTDQRLTSILDTATSTTVYLGQDRFPAVIAANSSIKAALESDAANNRLWTDRGVVSTADGTHDYGFLDQSGQIVSSDIHGSYDIYVNPAGVGSWVNGSAEGVLESVWIAKVYYGAYSDSELSDQIRSFYSTFYRCDLSNGQVADILAGA